MFAAHCLSAMLQNLLSLVYFVYFKICSLVGGKQQHVAIVGVKPLYFLKRFESMQYNGNGTPRVKYLSADRYHFYGIPDVQVSEMMLHSFDVHRRFPDSYFRSMRAFIVVHNVMTDSAVKLFAALTHRNRFIQKKPLVFILKVLQTQRQHAELFEKTQSFMEHLRRLVLQEAYFSSSAIRVFHEAYGSHQDLRAVEWLFRQMRGLIDDPAQADHPHLSIHTNCLS